MMATARPTNGSEPASEGSGMAITEATEATEATVATTSMEEKGQR